VSLEVVTQLPGCNENRIKQLIHLRVPCLGFMEDFAYVVDWSLDGPDPPEGFRASTSMGSGSGGPSP
jgi:hypothetical protein